MPSVLRTIRQIKRQDRAIARKVNNAIRGYSETKQVDHTWNAVAVSDSGGPISEEMCSIAQGLTQNTRVGNRLTITGMYGNLQIIGADTTNIVRVVFYIPHDVDTTLSGLNTYGLVDQDQVTVLYDRTFVTGTGGPSGHAFRIKKSFTRGNRKGIAVHYSSSASTSCVKNNLKLYVVSDSGAVSHPTLSGQLRIYFKDL